MKEQRIGSSLRIGFRAWFWQLLCQGGGGSREAAGVRLLARLE